MKKLILIVALLVLSITPVTAQNVEPYKWTRIHKIEEYFSLFEVNIEAWYNPVTSVLNFEDSYSRDFDDMLFQWGYLMTAFEFMLEDSGQVFADLEVETMVYSFFLIIDNRYSKFEEPNLVYHLFMERYWCIDYFYSNRRERQEMLYDLFDKHYTEWFPEKRQF